MGLAYITTNAYSELSINKEDGFEIVSAETVSQLIAEAGGADSYDTITSGKTIKQTLNISNLPTDVTLSRNAGRRPDTSGGQIVCRRLRFVCCGFTGVYRRTV